MMKKRFMLKVLRSIELKFCYILYVYKNFNLNVIKYGNVKVFNRFVGEF